MAAWNACTARRCGRKAFWPAGWARGGARWRGWPPCWRCSTGRRTGRAMRRRPASSRRSICMPPGICGSATTGRMQQAVFDRAGPADRARQGQHQARQHARRVIGWIRARGAAEISREDVRREALSQRVNAAGADEVILALEQAGVAARGRGRRRGLSGPRPPGAALAGQSGGCSQNPLRKLRKVPASPAQLGRCRRHTTPALSEVEGTEGSEASGRGPPQNRLRKLRKNKPRPAGQNDQRDQIMSLLGARHSSGASSLLRQRI